MFSEIINDRIAYVKCSQLFIKPVRFFIDQPGQLITRLNECMVPACLQSV